MAKKFPKEPTRPFNSYVYPIVPVKGEQYSQDGILVPSTEFELSSLAPTVNVLMFCPLAIMNDTRNNPQVKLYLELYNDNGNLQQQYSYTTGIQLRKDHLWYNVATNLDGYTMYCDVMSNVIKPGSKIEYYNNDYTATFGNYARLATVGRANTMETEIRTPSTNNLASQSLTEYEVPNYNIVRNDVSDDWTPIVFYRYASMFAGGTGPTADNQSVTSNIKITHADDKITIKLLKPNTYPIGVYYYTNASGTDTELSLKSSLEIPNTLTSNPSNDNYVPLTIGTRDTTLAKAQQYYFKSNNDSTSVFKDYNGTEYQCTDGDLLAVHTLTDYIEYKTINVEKPALSLSGNKLSWDLGDPEHRNTNSVKSNVKYKVYRDDSVITTTTKMTYSFSTTDNYGEHTWKVEVVPSSLSKLENTAFYSGSGELVPYLNKIRLEIPRVTASNKYSDPVTSYITANNNVTTESLNVPDGQKIHVTSDGGQYYKYQLDNGSWSGYIPIASDTTFSDLSYGDHTVKVKIYVDNQGHGESSVINKTFSLVSLIAPSGLSFARTIVDGGIFTYTLLQNLPVNSYKFKISLNNGALVDNGNNTSYNISGGLLGNNTVVVVLEYYNNNVHKSDFDSSASLTFELTKLQQPVAIGLENYNSNGGVSSIRMQWGAVDYAADYAVYCRRTHIDPETGLIVTDPPSIHDNADGLSVLISDPTGSGTIKLGSDPGLYRFTVKALASGVDDSLSQFDSYESTVGPNLEFEIHVLKAPVIAWKSASTGLLSQDSTLMWATPIDPEDDENIPDYYMVNINAAVDGTRLLFGTIPNDTENGMEYNIVDNLLPNPTSTYAYMINVVPNSYNTLYYQPASTSVSNNLQYSVKKLATPTNVTYDIDHQTISWDNITDANIYYVYEINENNLSILWGTSDTNSFEFDTPLDAGLHYFYVVAGRITYEED